MSPSRTRSPRREQKPRSPRRMMRRKLKLRRSSRRLKRRKQNPRRNRRLIRRERKHLEKRILFLRTRVGRGGRVRTLADKIQYQLVKLTGAYALDWMTWTQGILLQLAPSQDLQRFPAWGKSGQRMTHPHKDQFCMSCKEMGVCWEACLRFKIPCSL